MTTNDEKKGGGTGKFFLGATLGALVGALAGKLILDNREQISKKASEIKVGLGNAKDDAKDKASELGGKIVTAGKTAKHRVTRQAERVMRDTKKATTEAKKAASEAKKAAQKVLKGE